MLDRSASVSWVGASGPVARYMVTANPGGSTVRVDAPETRTTVPDLDNRTSYTFTVVALTAADEQGPPTSSGSQPSLKTVADWYMTGSMTDFLAAKGMAPPPRPFNWNDDSCLEVIG